MSTIKNFFKKLSQKVSSKVCCDINLSLDPEEFLVYLTYPKVTTLKCYAKTTVDLYDLLMYMMLNNIEEMTISSATRLLSKFTIYYNGKPLSRRNIALSEYGVINRSQLTVVYHGMLGGNPMCLDNILLPTYNIVESCEKMVLAVAKYQIQSHEEVFRNFAELFTRRMIDDPSTIQAFGLDVIGRILAPGQFNDIKDPSELEWLAGWINSYMTVAIDLYYAENIDARLRVVEYYIKYRYNLAIPGKLTLSIIMRALRKLLIKIPEPPTSYEAQGFFEFMHKTTSTVDELLKSPVFKHIKQIGLFLMSLSLLDRFGISFDLFNFSEIDIRNIRNKNELSPSVLYTLLKSFATVLEKVVQCYKANSLDPLFHNGSQYEKWYDEAMLLKAKAAQLHNPEAFGFSEFDFLHDIDDVIERGDGIYKHAVKIAASERKMIAAALGDLKVIKSDRVTKRAAQQMRKAPFLVSLFGGSSIGKTTLTDMLFFQYGKTFNLPIDNEYKFTRNPNANFWDGFNSSQWFVILDDVAFLKPTIASQGDPTIMELIQIKNNACFVPDQADLANKGRTPFKARAVVATTNCEDLNVYAYFQTPLAASRRVDFYIDATVKPECAKYECMLDSAKVQQFKQTGEWPNYWNFTIKVALPASLERNKQMARLEEVHRFTDVDDFLAWYSREAVKFDKIQDIVLTNSNEMSEIKICEKCYYNMSKCHCFQSQGMVSNIIDKCKLIAFDGCVRVARTDIPHRAFDLIINDEKIVNSLRTMIVDRKPSVPCATWENIVVQLESTLMMNEDFDCISAREQMYQYGQRVYNSLKKPMFYIPLLSTLGFLLYKIYNEKTKYYEGRSQDSLGQAPPCTDDKRQNVWVRDHYEMSTFDISGKAKSLKGQSFEQIVSFLKHNLVSIRCEFDHDVYGRAAKNARALCIGGHIYITNRHNLPHKDCTLYVNSSEVVDGVNGNVKMLLSNELVYYNVSHDLAAFRIDCLPPRKDLTDMFISKNNKAILKGHMIQRNSEGKITTTKVHNYRRSDRLDVTEDLFTIDCWYGIPEILTKVGECGSIHLAETPMGPQILGLHMAGNDKECVVTTVHDQIINDIKSFFDKDIVGSAHPLISSESAPRELIDLSVKSTLRWMPVGVAAAYGSYAGWRNSNKSTVKPTIIQKSVLEEGYQLKHGAPIMSSYEPWRVAALDMVAPVTDLNQAILKRCKESFLNDILKGISKSDLAEVMVYDDKTALNGAKGVAYVDSMNRNTSMGAPWRKGKKFFLIDLPPTEDLPNGVEFTPEIMERVNVCITRYENGERYMPVFTGQLKDEALPFRKITAKKTRVFTGAPADWSLVVRKYLLSVIRLIQKNKFVFETAVGTNAVSTQWSEIRTYLTQHGEDNMIAGDYGRFDKTMPPCIILAAFDIMKNICKAAGYTPTQLKVVQGIAEDTAFPLVDFNGDLIEFYGSNPSGHPLTVIVNSLANSLYMRYCYSVLSPEKSCFNFKRDVALITYGDDNAMGVQKTAQFFNHTAIQETLRQVGITYTMADKEAESVPYIHIDQISFLKRLWRYDEDMQTYLAPLEEDSISKSLLINTESKAMCPEAHIMEVMSSACQEYFNYGKNIYNEKLLMFQRLVEKNNLQPYVKDNSFPTWDELAARFRNNSK